MQHTVATIPDFFIYTRFFYPIFPANFCFSPAGMPSHGHTATAQQQQQHSSNSGSNSSSSSTIAAAAPQSTATLAADFD
jgi:hypothetical protein